jgi:hypothetical protein
LLAIIGIPVGLVLVGGLFIAVFLLLPAPSPVEPLPPADMTLREFVIQKPHWLQTRGVHVDCTLDTYYGGLYHLEAETHYSVCLDAVDGPPQRCYAYVLKQNDSRGRIIFDLLKDGRTKRLTLKLMRIGPQGMMADTESDHFYIAAIVGHDAP